MTRKKKSSFWYVEEKNEHSSGRMRTIRFRLCWKKRGFPPTHCSAPTKDFELDRRLRNTASKQRAPDTRKKKKIRVRNNQEQSVCWSAHSSPECAILDVAAGFGRLLLAAAAAWSEEGVPRWRRRR